jgi:hypothetical protein
VIWCATLLMQINVINLSDMAFCQIRRSQWGHGCFYDACFGFQVKLNYYVVLVSIFFHDVCSILKLQSTFTQWRFFLLFEELMEGLLICGVWTIMKQKPLEFLIGPDDVKPNNEVQLLFLSKFIRFHY